MYDSKAPGVYIEEVSGGARPIQAVGTSTAGFVGVVLHPDAPVNEAVAVNNWAEFVRAFHVDVARDLRLARAQADQAEAALAREEKALQPAKTALDTAAAALPTAEAGVKTAEAAVKAARQAVDAAAGEDADAQQAAAAKL
ncbi:MAG: hypothetical protein KC425_02470, partial [Anaerolineales bacterium]|nr:hypothetical protein [Anaerolineales bacterium]